MIGVLAFVVVFCVCGQRLEPELLNEVSLPIW